MFMFGCTYIYTEYTSIYAYMYVCMYVASGEGEKARAGAGSQEDSSMGVQFTNYYCSCFFEYILYFK